jgi:hypothetical protein
MLFKSVEVRCPYCGTVNMVDIEFPGYSQPRVITCDIEQGGCDKYFVVQPHVNVEVKTYKIEGMED